MAITWAVMAHVGAVYPYSAQSGIIPTSGLTEFSVGIIGLCAILASILTLSSSEDEPRWIAMLADGFRLAFVYGAPVVLLAVMVSLGSQFGTQQLAAASLAAGVLSSVLNGFIFALLFHLFRKVFIFVSRLGGQGVYFSIALTLLMVYLSGHGIVRYTRNLKEANEINSGSPHALPTELARKVPAGIYEDFDRSPWVVVEDGRGGFVFGGNFHTYAGHHVSKMTRVNKSGQLDLSFHPDLNGGIPIALTGGMNGDIYGFSRGPASGFSGLFKINVNGTRDPTFSKNASVVEIISQTPHISTLSDGRLILSNSFRYGEVTGLVCLGSDGRPDDAFMANARKALTPTHFVGQARGLPSGKTLIMTSRGFLLLRSDGTLDSVKFPPETPMLRGLVLSSTGDCFLSLIDGDNRGAKETRFKMYLVDGWAYPDIPFSMKSRGKKITTISLGGRGEIYLVFSDTKGKSLLRFRTTGELDGGFKPNLDPTAEIVGTVTNVLPLSDGGVMLVGDMRAGPFGTGRTGHVLRLMEDGSLDPSFWPM